MANRRMFSKDVVETDKFLNMPLTSQTLYFHLGMEADDDGFVASPKKVQRSIGCSEGDLQILASRGFIIPFESGIVVLVHWKQNNYIQADRYRKTVHKEEAALLQNDNYVYSLVPTCIHPVSSLDPQDSIGKDRVGKDSIDTLCHVSHDDVDKSHIEIIEYLNLKTGSKFKPTTKPYVQAIRSRLKEGYTVDDFKTVIDKKCREWKGTKLEKYLTPKTLFAPSHFDTYLNSNEMAAMTDTERKINELNALIDAVERGADEGTERKNVDGYGPIIDISEY